jgi:hypothetical protein
MTDQPRVSESVSKLISSFESMDVEIELRKLLTGQLKRLSGELEEASKMMMVADAKDIHQMSSKVGAFLRSFDQTIEAISKLGFRRRLDKDIARHKSKH